MGDRFSEKLGRMLAAVHLEKPDRIPVMGSGSAVNAALTGTKLSDYCADLDLNLTTNLEGMAMVGDPDGVQVTIFEPKMLDACWFGHMETPGVELPDNDLWQMVEKQNVLEEDYDRIIEMGFGPWYMEFLTQRLHWNPGIGANFAAKMGPAIGAFAAAGFPCFCGSTFWTPIEMFCGGRTLIEFVTVDLMDMPDKVERVFDLAHEFNMAGWREQLARYAGYAESADVRAFLLEIHERCGGDGDELWRDTAIPSGFQLACRPEVLQGAAERFVHPGTRRPDRHLQSQRDHRRSLVPDGRCARRHVELRDA